jgi:type I restriction enzyme S subunit
MNNWQTKNLSELCNFFADGDWIEKKDQSEEGIRLIQTGNVGSGYFKDRVEKARYISEKTFKRLNCREILPGDCFISRLPDPVGRACIIPETGEKMITAVDCTIIRFKKEILPKWFISYSLSDEYQRQINKEVGGATRQRISRKSLGQITVPLPPLLEQKRIVKILDEAFKKLEKAKENVKKNLNNSKELFNSYLQGIFSSPNNNWQEKQLEELGQITSSKRIYKKEYAPTGIPFYRIKEIKELAHDKKVTIELHISKDRYEEIKNVFGIPKEGDILMTAVGTIGEIYVVKKDEAFYFKDGNILWFKDFDTVDPSFLKYALMSFVEQINKLSKGSAYSALTIEKIERHKICIPTDIKEQRSIVKKLNQLSEQTRKLESIYQRKLSAIEELKKSILHKAFSGEL